MIAAVLSAVVALALSSAGALADTGGDNRLYFPHVARFLGTGAPDTCSAIAPCSGSGDWALHCGGFGRVRDAFSRGGDGDTRTVVAVGDGAARWQPESNRWQVQIGHDLSGLSALHLGDEGSGDGWAVGERTRLSRFGADGCWTTDDKLINGQLSLSSVIYEGDNGRGWAVGSRGRSGVLLRLRTEGGDPVWSDATGLIGAGLPPLSDFSLSNLDPPVHDAWLVSEEASQLLEARLGTTPNGETDVAEVTNRVAVVGQDGLAARPREIAMRHDDGWLVGEDSADSAEASVETWRHVGDSDWWPGFGDRPGRIVDLYFDNSLGQWWMGLSPVERGGVLRTTRSADGSEAWEHLDSNAPMDAAADGADGHSAIAPLRHDRVLYAWGDLAWVYNESQRSWQEVLRRRQLVGVVGHGLGAWALEAPLGDRADTGEETGAENGATSRLLSWQQGELREVAYEEGQPGDPTSLTALDGNAGEAWAVGSNGETLRQRGTTGWWQQMASVAHASRLTDVAVAPDGAVWAIGLGDDGRYGMWHYDEVTESWPRLATSDRVLHAVAAARSDLAFAVGDGVACNCAHDTCVCYEGLKYMPDSGEEPVELNFRAVTGSYDAPDWKLHVWAAGDYDGTSYVVRHRRIGGWQASPARLLAGLPRGATVVDLASGDGEDVWSVATCLPYAQEGRGVSIVSHWRGLADVQGDRIEAREVLALSVPANDLSLGDDGQGLRTLWLAGDWSSLLSLTYPIGARPPGAHLPPEPDLRCTPADR